MKPEWQAALFFVAAHEIVDIAPFGAGHVNDTFLLTLTSGEERVLQRINPEVFPRPVQVIANLRRVTDHLQQAGCRPEMRGQSFEPLRLYGSAKGDACPDQDGGAWRLLNRISGLTIPAITTANQARELGRCLGLFHRLLSTLDPACLEDPLPGFHVTPRYLADYDRVCAGAGKATRPADAFCRLFIEQRRTTATLLEDARDRLRTGVIHGDPKAANFLFAAPGGQVISLIDLDTVQPGLLLHDLADSLRSCCNAAGETPALPEQAIFAPDLFAAWLEGYLDEARTLLGDDDLALLVEAVALIAFELGLRFYTDYLEGDRYFKVTSTRQNLERARTQFHLSRSIEEQRVGLAAIVARLSRAKNIALA